MNNRITPEQIDHLARRRAGAKLRWYAHAAVYVVVNLFLFTLASHSRYASSMFPALGWGLGLALHGISVWILGAGSELRERMVQNEREKLQRQQDQQGPSSGS